MNNTTSINSPSVDSDLTVEWLKDTGPAIMPLILAFYAEKVDSTKIKIDRMGAEVSERQDKMLFIKDLYAQLNNLSDAKVGLDLTKEKEICQKLQLAKEYGAEIHDNKVKFTPDERDNLLTNLRLAADKFDKINTSQTQKMQIYINDMDRLTMLLKEAQKCDSQGKRSAISGVRGG